MRGGRAAALAACTAVAGAHALHYWPHVVDDAFIHLRYAEHVLAGHGFRFNPTDARPVEGFSSPAWLALAIAAGRAGVGDVLAFGKLVGLGLHATLVVGTWRLVRSLRQPATPFDLIAPALVAVSPFLAYHAVAGLEGPLVALLMAVAGVAILETTARPGGSAGWGALLATTLVLLTASRPEGFGWAGTLVATAFWLGGRDPATRRLLVRVTAVWLLGWAALAVWRWEVFGALVPNAAARKVLAPGALAASGRGLRYVSRFFAAVPVPLDAVVYGGAIGVLLARGTRPERALLVLPVAALGFALVVDGDWMHSFRFLAPVIPFLGAAVARATARLAARSRPLGGLAIAAVAALALQLAWLDLATVTAAGYTRGRKAPRWPLALPEQVRRGFDAPLTGITRWGLTHVAPGATLATGDVGFPGATLAATVVDLMGLTDATLARLVPAGDATAYGAYLRARRPDFILVRLADGRPAKSYDALTVASGLLADYEPAAEVPTHGSTARATVYRRRDAAPAPPPSVVLARFERAIERYPRVPALRAWRDGYRAALDAPGEAPP